MSDVDEVLSRGSIRRLAGTRPWVVGVLIRKKHLVGVVDPARVAKRAGGSGEHVMVLRGEPGLGLLVERTDTITHECTVIPAPSARAMPELGADKVLQHPGGSYVLLELDELRRRLGA